MAAALATAMRLAARAAALAAVAASGLDLDDEAAVAAAQMATPVQMQNIVATTTVARAVQLRHVALRWRRFGAQYNSKRFAAVIRRFRRPQTAVLLFGSGHLVCTGAKSMRQVEAVVAAVVADLRRYAGYTRAAAAPIHVRNAVGNAVLAHRLQLAVLAGRYNQYVSYEPSVFKGAIIRLPRLEPVVVLAFDSGCIVISGGRSLAELDAARRAVLPMLWRARDTPANRRAAQSAAYAAFAQPRPAVVAIGDSRFATASGVGRAAATATSGVSPFGAAAKRRPTSPAAAPAASTSGGAAMDADVAGTDDDDDSLWHVVPLAPPLAEQVPSGPSAEAVSPEAPSADETGAAADDEVAEQRRAAAIAADLREALRQLEQRRAANGDVATVDSSDSDSDDPEGTRSASDNEGVRGASDNDDDDDLVDGIADGEFLSEFEYY